MNAAGTGWWIAQSAAGSRPAVAVAIDTNDTGRCAGGAPQYHQESRKGWAYHAA